MISGILNVYKEKGYTSHDVVAKLRGILGQRKIGHTGTLDPQAEGVLPVCLGAGTKLCDLLTDTGKTYRAVLLLGQTTDTQDADGEVLERREARCSAREAEAAVRSFVGVYDQIPPMYSARKVQGKRLYELARAGVEVAREARPVSIERIVIEQTALPRLTFTVDCSKGTYIRTLCHDIGQKLGCGGCMEELLRLRVGTFRLEDSLKLGEIERLWREGELGRHIRSVDEMFPGLLQVRVSPGAETLLRNGNPLRRGQMEGLPKDASPDRLRLYDTSGRFCAIYSWEPDRDLYVPEKMFPD